MCNGRATYQHEYFSFDHGGVGGEGEGSFQQIIGVGVSAVKPSKAINKIKNQARGVMSAAAPAIIMKALCGGVICRRRGIRYVFNGADRRYVDTICLLEIWSSTGMLSAGRQAMSSSSRFDIEIMSMSRPVTVSLISAAALSGACN